MSVQTLSPYIPSLIIAAWTVLAFLLGSLFGRVVPPSLRGFLMIAVLLVSVGVGVYFVTTKSSPYALLLPTAFAVGAFISSARRKSSRRVFRDR